MPDLILLEVLTERYKGFEVLEFLRSDTQLSQIPVVVFTDASDSRVLKRAKKMGAKCVLEKEPDLTIANKLLAFARNIGLCGHNGSRRS